MSHKILKDVHEDHTFYLLTGKELKNLQNLHDSLGSMDDHVYEHHANEHKNDFHNWVKHVHEDDHLADNLKKAKNKHHAASEVRKRIKLAKRSKVRNIVKSKSKYKRRVKHLQHHEYPNPPKHKNVQLIAGIAASAFLILLVGLTSQANQITGASSAITSNVSSASIAGFGALAAVLFLLVILLHRIKEK